MKMKTALKGFFTKSENIAALLVSAFLVWLLLINPIAGIADNGDFIRALLPTSMSVPDDIIYFDFVTEEYHILNALPLISPSYICTHVLPVTAAKMLNVLTYSRDMFNIRYMSFLYIVIFAAAVIFVLRGFKSEKLWQNILIFALFIFMFANTGNVLYFGSLYAEPTAFVFFFAAVGALRLCINPDRADKSAARWYIVFLVCAAMFFGSKMQYAPLVILLIPLSVFAVYRFADHKKSIIAVTSAACAACLLFYICQPTYLDDVTTFDSVFCGIVTDEESAGKYLGELGLPQEYAALAGMDAFRDEYPIDINSDEFRENFYDKIGKGTMVKFYLTHPDFFIKMMDKTAKACYLNMPRHLGNRTVSYSSEATLYTNFQHYCDFKLKCFPKNFWCIAGFLILYLLWLIYRLKNSFGGERLWLIFMIDLVLFAGVQYVLPTVGNGGADLAKQLYMFNVAVDFMLFYAIYSIVKFLALRQTRVEHIRF